MGNRPLLPIVALVVVFGVALGLAILISTHSGAQSNDEPAFDSGSLAQGDTWSHTFDEEGRFAYHCTPHPWMQASIVVTPDAPREADEAFVVVRDFEYEPQILEVRPGTTVTWSNQGSTPHTVTADPVEQDTTDPTRSDGNASEPARATPLGGIALSLLALGAAAAVAGRR